MRRLSYGGRGALCAGLALVQAAALAAPTITRVSTPGGAATTTAAPGDELLIQGSGFGSASGEVWLDRGGYGREASVMAWNDPDGSIRIRIPASADLGSIGLIVRAGDAGSAPYPLQLAAAGSPPVLPAPLSSSTPPPPAGTPAAPAVLGVNVLGGGPTTSGYAGTQVRISGARLGSGGELRFNGALAAAVRVWTPSYIVATLPDATGAGPITVRRDPGLPDEATGVGPTFTIVPPPAITGYWLGGAPTVQAQPGDVIAVRGTNLGTGGQVWFQGSQAAVRRWTPQEIDVVVPDVQGTVPVRIVLSTRTGAEAGAQGPDLTVTTAN
jgi:hypothetical protein